MQLLAIFLAVPICDLLFFNIYQNIAERERGWRRVWLINSTPIQSHKNTDSALIQSHKNNDSAPIQTHLKIATNSSNQCRPSSLRPPSHHLPSSKMPPSTKKRESNCVERKFVERAERLKRKEIFLIYLGRHRQ